MRAFLIGLALGTVYLVLARKAERKFAERWTAAFESGFADGLKG